jgi:hypothetical protein
MGAQGQKQCRSVYPVGPGGMTWASVYSRIVNDPAQQFGVAVVAKHFKKSGNPSIIFGLQPSSSDVPNHHMTFRSWAGLRP